MRILHYADLENAPDHPSHAARLSGAIRDRRDDVTVVTGGGDNTAPGVLSLATDGRHALDVFDRIRPDLDTLGNHDFDNGLEATRRIVRASPQTWVCANLYLEDERFGHEVGIVPWTVVERAGERLGVIGITDPATPDITPPAAPLTTTDPVEAAADAIDELRDLDIDWFVALSHLGHGDDRLARAVEFDVILGGHVHESRIDHVADTLVVRPGANASGIVEVQLDEDPYALYHDLASAPVDESLQGALQERMTEVGLSEVVATVTDPLERTRDAIRRGDCDLAVLLAEAYRHATDADVGLQNSGGVRNGPHLVGDVTAADLVGVVPFDEPVAIAELTGEELRTVLDAQRPTSPEEGWRGYASGVTVTWDDGILDSVAVNGEPLDPKATYRLATSEYVFGTPYEFPTLTTQQVVSTTERTQYRIVVDFAREGGLDPTVITPDLPPSLTD